MNYKCLIIDDEPLARELIETYLKQIPKFEVAASFSSAIEASTFLNNTAVDLLFLDIEMPVLKGTDFFKNLVKKPKVIFTTAYRDYALDGFELNAIDYLLKPIFFERFFLAIQKFLEYDKNNINLLNIEKPTPEVDYIYVSKSKKQIKVNLGEILYIESLKDYIKINLTNEALVIKESISKFEKRINSRFIRIHRSYIVNQDMITAYTKNDIEIGKIELPIGNSYRKNIELQLL